MVEEDLNLHPGVWHGIAEGHIHLSAEERLEMALKACDLYLRKLEALEELLIRARTERHVSLRSSSRQGKGGAPARDTPQ